MPAVQQRPGASGAGNNTEKGKTKEVEVRAACGVAGWGGGGLGQCTQEIRSKHTLDTRTEVIQQCGAHHAHALS